MKSDAELAGLKGELKQVVENIIRSEKRATDFATQFNHVLEDEDATISKVIHAMLGQQENAANMDMSWLNRKGSHHAGGTK
ncbi:MAG: hypothetical protein JJE25_03460 [Bacteroidia bacterium]|nr:hypothetical protein [Bacteroidia bacterium]